MNGPNDILPGIDTWEMDLEEGAVIEENCLLESCLIGKGATISAGTVMSGEIVNHI